MAIAQQHIPPRPTKVSVRLPALSTSATWSKMSGTWTV